jgi:hypothetical protein
VQWHATSDVARYLKRAVASDLFYVHNVATVAHRQMDGVVCRLVQVAHKGHGRVTKLTVVSHHPAQFKEADTRLMVRAVAFQEATLHKGGDDPMRRRLGQTRSVGELGEAKAVDVGPTEGVEHRKRPTKH